MRYLSGVTTLELDVSMCSGCELCTEVCPHAVFKMEDGQARIVDADACMECGACERNCESGALTVRAGVGCAASVMNKVFRGSQLASCGQDNSPCCGS